MQKARPVNMNASTTFTSGGAVHYTAPQSMPQYLPGLQHPAQTPVYAPVQPVLVDSTDPSSPSSKHVMLKNLVTIFSRNVKDRLPEWTLTQFKGDPLSCNERFGQFRRVVDSAYLTNDLKLFLVHLWRLVS